MGRAWSGSARGVGRRKGLRSIGGVPGVWTWIELWILGRVWGWA